MKLSDLGWSGFFEEQYKRFAGSGLFPGRIVSRGINTYVAETENGRVNAVAVQVVVAAVRGPCVCDGM